MMQLQDVGVGYTPEQNVLRSVSLHLEPGGFYFLTGPSGAGKSTLLRILGLTLPAARGEIHIFGENIRNLSHDKMPALRRKIGMVFQDHQLLDHLSVSDNIALPLKIAGESKDQIEIKVHELLDWVGLANHANDFPPTLSGGMKQRAAIARAVINNPLVLLADEPTGNLDPSLSLKFMYLFQALNKMGTTVLFATHDENLISMFSYPVLRLKDGALTLRDK
ncbi:MAG: cell division ATP-binding protein FtsE [Alphaproteobacteria bacterium]|nr:cell division ATP-binding protein FtsE [Alphaproteobacteria bacterium]